MFRKVIYLYVSENTSQDKIKTTRQQFNTNISSLLNARGNVCVKRDIKLNELYPVYPTK